MACHTGKWELLALAATASSSCSLSTAAACDVACAATGHSSLLKLTSSTLLPVTMESSYVSSDCLTYDGTVIVKHWLTRPSSSHMSGTKRCEVYLIFFFAPTDSNEDYLQKC
ncbi:unnamed protein product [Urochloa humidicola]